MKTTTQNLLSSGSSSQPALLDSSAAAEYLCVAKNSLRNSRHTGTLAGTKTPKFLKMGHKVVYERSVLDEWLAQFESKPNTAA